MLPELHPYQQYAADFVVTHPKCGLFLDMGLGKAIDDETILPTPDGPRQVKDIQQGDTLFSMNGNPTTVLAVYKHKKKMAFKVTLDDGRSFICCDEHLLPIHRPGLDSVMPVPLKNIMDSYKATDQTTGQVFYQYAIPWNEPVQYPETNRPFTGTDFGAAIAFGSIQNGSLKIHDDTPDWITAHFQQLEQNTVAALTAECTAIADQNGTITRLPDWCLMTDPMFKSRMLIAMAGLDIRDTASIRDTKYLEITLPEKDMAEQLQQIVWSMGHRMTYTWRPRKKIAELKISFSKADDHQKGLKIVDIERVPDRDMTCFTVSDPTHTYLINDYLVTHNTLITLMALWRIAPPGHILVVAPKTIARSTWQNEIIKWGIPVRTKSLVVNENGKDLTRKKRLALYEQMPEEPPTMYFINREKITDLIANLPVRNGIKVWPFHTMVVDELQSFKNYASDRTKALIKVAPLCERFIGLTGTPTPQGLMDLWPEIYFMDNGARLGKNITAYRNRWFKSTMIVNNHPVGWVPLPGAEDEIYSLINDLVISIKNPNIKLPPVTFNDVHITLDTDEMALYKQFAKESALILDDGKTVTAKNAGQLRIKLTQLASGSVYTEKGNADSYRIIHEKKLDVCEYIVNNSSGSILIAYQFQADKEMLKKRFPNAIVFDGSPEMQQEWNDRKIPILLINPASAGHGLNIQYGGHTLVWYTTPTNLEFYLQCNARLARQGQPDPVTIHHLIVDGTVDQANLKLVNTKDANEEKLIEAVQAAVDFALS